MKKVSHKSIIARCLIFILLISICSQCKNIAMDLGYSLRLQNNTEYSMGYYIALGDVYASTAYPDTTLPIRNIFLDEVVYPNEKAVIYRSDIKWEEIFSIYLPADTLSVFVFHADTLSHYSWEEIREDYKILKRYDLSLEDLTQNNWTITYP